MVRVLPTGNAECEWKEDRRRHVIGIVEVVVMRLVLALHGPAGPRKCCADV
jgi:hypothetical protein